MFEPTARALAWSVVTLAVVALGCASNDRGRDDYEGRYPRNDPYYRRSDPYPYGYGGRYGDHESPLERHQEREQRALDKQHEAEDENLRHEQRDEHQDLKQTDQWDKDDQQRQHQEKQQLEQQQHEEQRELDQHQKQERKGSKHDWD